MRRQYLPLVATLVAATLVGCATQKANFYTLSQEAPGENTRPATQLTVVVGSVTVPELVDRPQIVVSTGANQVHIDEFARWAEPLKTQIPRVVAGDLAQILNSARVSASPMAGDATVWRVRLDVQRFEAALGEAVTVDVVWSVSVTGKSSPISGRTTVREPCAGTDYDALVAAWSKALAIVSGEIGAAISTASAS